tara:strand:+ start:84 stop:278 length:195 start_codon:yes stop_codon:yes gene_type:complete
VEKFNQLLRNLAKELVNKSMALKYTQVFLALSSQQMRQVALVELKSNQLNKGVQPRNVVCVRET